MTSLRYVRLWLALARFSLVRELAFRANFLIRIFVEILWLGILVVFYFTLFEKTDEVATWTKEQYFFFVGCYFAMSGLIEMLFLENCNSFADLVRTGDLDFYLIKPIDEQFLVTCKSIDWSCLANVLMGAGMMGLALHYMPDWTFDPVKTAAFGVLFVCGVALAYGFLLMLTSASVWFMRNQSLYEVWWLAMSLMRYPREIFQVNGHIAAQAAGVVFFFFIPVMLITNVPASVMVKTLEPWIAVYTLVGTVAVVWVSRWIFRAALKRYRSASS